MFCINCGQDNTPDSEYCIKCGKRAHQEDATKTKSSGWSRKKVFFFSLLLLILSSGFWILVSNSFSNSTEDEAVNILSHALETVGRQKQAWTKAENIISLISYTFSDKCIKTKGCTDESISEITTLRAEIDKESEEINNLWSRGILSLDYQSYLSKLNTKNQIKLYDIFKIYFPEESDEIKPSAKLL